MSFHPAITAAQRELIELSKVFFVASADPSLDAGPRGEGPVNLSPKGGVPLHVLDEGTVAYLDFPGSGNETARHAAAGGPVTVMVMSVDATDAAIVRLYGRARVCPLAESPHAALLAGDLDEGTFKARQVVTVDVEQTQTSCGFGVPVFGFVGDRTREQRGKRFW